VLLLLLLLLLEGHGQRKREYAIGDRFHGDGQT
jgi:hypothetical protein